MSTIVVFDVDITVGCGVGETCGCGPRPGIPLTLRVLSALGFTAHLTPICR